VKEHDVPKELRGKKREGKHPLKEFARTLGDFQRGIGRLDSVTSALSRTSKPVKETGRDRILPGLKEVIRERAVPAGVLARSTFKDASASRLPAIYPRSPGSPHSAMRYRIKDTARGPEDREALAHLREVVRPLSYEGLPRAVRAALAQEMKSKNPERDVKATLPGSAGSRAGGQDAPSKHWRPEISKMVERYQTELRMATSKLERAERAIYGTTVSPRSHSMHVSQVSNQTSSMMPKLAEGASAEQLLEHNDITHVSGHGERLANETMRNRKVPNAPSSSPKPSKEHRLPSGGGGQKGAAVSPSKDSGSSAIPAARKLTGTLTILGNNGTVAGSAKLDATEG
jgi:hypothetical protein